MLLLGAMLLGSILLPLISASLEQVHTDLNANAGRYNKDLCDLVDIQSISSLKEHQPDLAKAAEWLTVRLIEAGLEHVQKLETGAQPVVYADWLHASGQPTILIYGHYDVQPVDPLRLWKTPPFECRLEDGAFKGRGVDDDKGGLLQPIHAIEALLNATGRLPVNVKFMLEGQEEIGSPQLDAFLAQHTKLLAADAALSADGGQISADQGGIPISLRGSIAVEIELQTVDFDLHSGMKGGSVLNPINALARLIGGLHDENHHVTVEGFYDGVNDITEADKTDQAAFPFDEAAEMKALGALGPVGESGFTTLERRWLRPTLDVVGIWGGFQGEGIKTIVPSKATAKISCRLVPDQDPVHITEVLRRHIQSHAPAEAKLTFNKLSFVASPYSMARESAINKAASAVLTEHMGQPTLIYREGGSIPALVLMRKHLGLESTMFAFGLPDDNLHSPNERYREFMFRRGRHAWADVLERISRYFGKDTDRPAVSEALEQATGEQQQAPQDQQQPQGSLFVTPEFTFTVPPGWEEVVEQAPSTPQAAGFGATYDGRPRGAPKISPVKARFSSPEGAQISVVERRSAEIKPTFLQVSDISGFGDLAAVQQLLVPPGSTVLRKKVQVQQQPQRQTTLGLVDTPPKNMFMYEFTQNGKHILMAAAAARGRVWITGGFAADSAWPRLGATIQTAVQSFKLNAPIIS
eukprot:jgi/Astpho2/2909/fgenesh1_pg.00050_%23_152_t